MGKADRKVMTGVLAASCALFAWTGWAETYTFTNDTPAGGSWFDANNWDTGVVPPADSTVHINKSGGSAYCIVDDTNAVSTFLLINNVNTHPQHLHIKSGADLTVSGWLSMAYGQTGKAILTIEGDLTIPYPRQLFVGDWGGPTVTPMGIVTQVSGSVDLGQLYVGGFQSATPVARYVLKGGRLD